MINLLRIAGSFVIVLVVYWTYALTAVPLIEPSLDDSRPAPVSEERIRHAEKERTGQQMAELAALFPPGSLEIKNPKILQSDRVKLLIGDYQTEPDGNVRIQPCVIILLPEPDGPAPAESLKQAIVLEAPRGALLRFDQKFDLARAKIGRLVGGRFDGPITIRSAGKTDDPDDDLLVVTQDVQLTEEVISTRDAVRFRHGPHFGSGREMRIRLLAGDQSGGGPVGQQSKVGGLESFELAHLDRLHLLLPGENVSLEPAAAAPPAAPPASQASSPPPASDVRPRQAVPVEITCEGPFRFDAVRREASFETRVVVTSLDSDTGQQDRLYNCDRLSVYFQRRAGKTPAAGATGTEPPGVGDLEPCRLVAVGNPVEFDFPSRSARGRAGRLDYDLIRKDATLTGETPVFLQYESHQIEARRIEYRSPQPPWLSGSAVAAGPGWIRGRINDRPDGSFEARWNGQLRFAPFEQNQVISFTGGAELAYGAIGRLAANEIYFYLFEYPPATGSQRPRLEPDRLKAGGDVRIGSPRISGELADLEVWFERAAGAAESGLVANSGDAGAPGGNGGAMGPPHGGSARHGQDSSAADPLLQGGPPAPAASASAQPPERHFHVTARLLQARVVLHAEGEQPDIAELTILDHVELKQTQTVAPDEAPVIVHGESIYVRDASKPYAALTVKGAPAHFEGRGLTMVGGNINLNQGTNVLSVEGPGWMDLPPTDVDLRGRPTPSKEPLRVEWRDRMKFDGRTMHLVGNVRAVSRLQQLITETLDASLNQMVRFAESEMLQDQSAFKLQQLVCPGKVWIESRSFDEQDGRLQQSYEQIEVKNLVVNNASGNLTADGPGWVHSVSRSSGGLGSWAGLPSLSPTAGQDATPAASPAAADPNSLNYLYVRFQGRITGNVHNREITFHDEVHALFGKVLSWEAALSEDNPDTWGPDGGLLNTDHLTVREMPSPVGGQRSTELEALGNTRIEGRDFAAFCTRMCYNQSKDMMLLEGDGQTKATLLRQKRVGGFQNKASAQRFLYWPKTGRAKSTGVGSVEINQAPGQGS